MPLLVITHFYSYLTYIFHLAAFLFFNLSYSTTRKLRSVYFFICLCDECPLLQGRSFYSLFYVNGAGNILHNQLWVCLSLNPTSSNSAFFSIHTSIMWIVVGVGSEIAIQVFRMHVLAAITI